MFQNAKEHGLQSMRKLTMILEQQTKKFIKGAISSGDLVGVVFMKKCNATDLGEIIQFVQTSQNLKLINEWRTTYRSTPDIKSIIDAASTEINIETKIIPIWERE